MCIQFSTSLKKRFTQPLPRPINIDGALCLQAWAEELPENDIKRNDILQGIKDGFHIVNPVSVTKPVYSSNYRSTMNFRSQVENQIITEIQNGRYNIVQNQPTVVSALGAIPKKGSKNIRLIHDCSRPAGASLNDHAYQEPFKYQSIQNAVNFIKPSYYLAKVDLMNAYRSVKIHPTNYDMTGIHWQFTGHEQPTWLVDTRLPFGAKCSPGIFNELSQAVCRIMQHKNIPSIIAYLDDFLIVAETKEICLQYLNTLLTLLRKLGFSINYKKVCGPSQRLTFLGIVLDTFSMTLELPRDKLNELKDMLNKSKSCAKLTKRQLQSIAGKLNWATQCVYGGRFYLRRIQTKINSLHYPWHHTRVTSCMKADIQWWLDFIDIFNGKTPMLDDRPITPVFIDACPVASGAVYNGDILYTPWKQWPETEKLHINFKETLSLELAVNKWAPLWTNRKVVVYCDNQAAVGIINRGSTSHPFVMASLRRIFWYSAIYNFRIKAIYLPGIYNNLADAVSRLHEPYGAARLVSVFRAMNNNFIYDSNHGNLYFPFQIVPEMHWNSPWNMRWPNTNPLLMQPQHSAHIAHRWTATWLSAPLWDMQPSQPPLEHYASMQPC